MAGVYGGTLNMEHLVWCAYSISPEAGCPLGCRAGDWGDVRRDADGGEDIRVRAIDALLPIGDTAVVNADPRCKLLLTQMSFFPIFWIRLPISYFTLSPPFPQIRARTEIAIDKSRCS